MEFPKSIYEIPGVREFQTKLNQLVSYIPPPPAVDQGTPRKILLVTSHPVPGSFSLAIAKTVEDTAKEQGHEVQRIDLGLEKFSPVLTRSERESYFETDARKRNIWKLPRDVRGYIQKLQWCDTLFFVYPTWWMNTPSNLKGFFDRTLLPYYTWDFPQASSSVSMLPAGLTPGLTNIQRIYGISTYGASRSIVALSGDNGRSMISKPVLQICHPDCTIRWLGLYDMDVTTIDRRQSFLEEVATMIKEQV